MDAWQKALNPHGELMPINERLWVVTVPSRSGPPRNMVIYRLDDGGLLLHGVHVVRPDTLTAIEALGPVRLMVASSMIHSMHEALYQARFPELTTVCPAASRNQLSRECRIDANLEDVADRYGFTVTAPPGVKPVERLLEVPVPGGYAWLTGDLLFNLPHLPGFWGLFTRLIGSSGFFGVTFLGRTILLQDRPAFRQWLEKQAKRTDLQAIVAAHGEVVTSECGERLQAAAARLR